MYQIDFNHPSSIYFVGIGGISMSGLAEILKDAGFRVSGSDRSKSPLTETLERKGINVFYGQRAGNITDDIDCVVFTSAIHKDNPEYVATMEKGIPHLTRAQLLGEIMQNYKTPIAVSGQKLCKFMEGIPDILQILEKVQVIFFDIQDHTDPGEKA